MKKNLFSWVCLLFLLLLIHACSVDSVTPDGKRPTPVKHPSFTPIILKTATPAPDRTPLPSAFIISPSLSEIPTIHPYNGPDPAQKPLHFILVQHARCAQNPFWCSLEEGVFAAARDLNVVVTILSPDHQDLAGMSVQIDSAIAAKPDGIALTISDPVVLREPILRAIRSGIPVIAYNAGAGPIQDDLPYLTFIGQNDYTGGYSGAYRLIKAGALAGVCINNMPNLRALQERCKGFENAFTEQGRKAYVLNTQVDIAQAEKDIRAFSDANPNVDAYLTGNPISAQAFYAYLKNGVSGKNKPNQIWHGTFDLDAEVSANIENGTTLFAIDQQPYLQGYEVVYWLAMITRYGLKPALPITSTGPRFVEKNNINTRVDPMRPVRLTFIHHGLCSWDPYWCAVDQGIYDAAKNMNVQITILGPKRFDLNTMITEIDQAVAARPDGMGVTVPDRSLLHLPILRAIQAGIPVIAFDTGSGPAKDNLPYRTFIGQDEYQGGYLGALRLINAGAKAGVCINHQNGQIALDQRCQGFTDAFSKKGLSADTLDCGGDPLQALQTLEAYAQAHPQVNAFLTLGAQNPGAISIYQYIKDFGKKPGDVLHGTFDISPTVVDAIKDGTTLFAIDAQPYLQGYSAVMFLTLGLRQGIVPIDTFTSTGPAFIDKSNITTFEKLAGKYR